VKLKIGDLVEWCSVKNDHQQDFDVDMGIVLNISRSGARSYHAEVLFSSNEIMWINYEYLRKVGKNESNSF
jgi:hypothetical protein